MHRSTRERDRERERIDEIAGAHRVEGELIASQLITPLVDYVQVCRAPASLVRPQTAQSDAFHRCYIINFVNRFPYPR